MRIAVCCIGLLLVTWARAEVRTETVAYQDGETTLRGFLAYDDARQGPRPGVLVVHEWWGLNDFARQKAQDLADLGYVAFAVDMFGEGRSTTDPAEAGRLTTPFRSDPEMWRRRARAGLNALARQDRVQRDKIAAIGFCFGGSTVLHLAASGAELAGVVSFHGSLFPFSAEDVGRVKARILVAHGAADSLVPDQAVSAFRDSLKGSAVDWQLIIYSGAKHGFMNAAADALKMDGVGYDALAARRAWGHMRQFCDELFGAARGAEARPPGGDSRP